MDFINSKIMTQPQKMEYIIEKGCEYFGLSKEKLTAPNMGKSAIAGKKKYISLVLSEYTAYNVVEIASELSYKSPQNVYRNILNLKEELSEEFYGTDKTKRIYNELLNYLQL